MKTIIRFEHPRDGIGIFFRDGDDPLRLSKIGLRDIANRHNRFNVPEMDGVDLTANGKEWFCAYKSVDQVKEWIHTDEIVKLTKHGYKILMLDVEEFQEGRDQVIFTKESIIASKDVTKLFI